MTRRLWTFIDGVITLPAFMLGYFVRAYINAYKYGGASYVENVRKYWIKP